MRLSVTIRSTIALACVGVELVASIAVKAPGNTARDASPSFPYDPNTTRYCTDWWDTLGLFSCQELVDIYSLNIADFVRWNPSITAACGNFIESGHSYCVGADGEPVVTTTVPPTKTTAGPTSTPTTSTPTTGPPPTTTVIDGTAYPIPPAPTILGSTPKCKKCQPLEHIHQHGLHQYWATYAICVSSPLAEEYWTLVGCTTDSQSARALANRITLPNEASIMTPKVCTDACATAGYRLSGIQYGSECYCDNAIRNGYALTSLGCTMPCPGAPSIMCGGSDRINLYRLDKYKDMGCYNDISTSRTLEKQIIIANQNAILTREICQDACEKVGYIYSGVEYAHQCWCGYSVWGSVAGSGCSSPCPGNTAQLCVGSDRINVMMRPQSRSLGCYSDDVNNRTLRYRLAIANEATLMTAELCRNTCLTKGFNYSGVEFGQQCFCDDELYGSGAPTTGCTMACPGGGGAAEEGRGTHRGRSPRRSNLEPLYNRKLVARTPQPARRDESNIVESASRRAVRTYLCHKSIVAYLSANNLPNAVAALRTELGLEEETFDAVTVKKYETLLEKKWTSIMDLESRVATLQSELDSATPSSLSKRSQDPTSWLPSKPSRYTLESHQFEISCIAFHPLYSTIASGDQGSAIKIWDWELGELERTIKGHTKAITGIDFGGPKGHTLLASCSSDLTIKLWDPADAYKNIRTLSGHDHTVSAVRFMPSGNLLVSASRDTTLRMWDVTTGYCVKTIRGHLEWVRDVCPSPDGSSILSTGDDRTLRLWNVSGSVAENKLTLFGHENFIECCVFAPPSSYQYLATLAGLQKPPPLTSTSEFMATGSRDKTIKLWDTRGSCFKTLIGHDNWVRSLVFHPGGKYLISVADDKALRCWDLSQDGKCVKELSSVHDHFISCLAWAPSIVKDKDKPPANGEAGGGAPDVQIRCVIATGSVDMALKIFAR
ncbi:hypothetical protein V501_04668 [Pseudogymnoascus sp. VKM F-4519 (FW-2642)]|nr:hypothetical protein V501_04668 [Pseudogymnoascus sp. VKM F-4519 (FW-2642)]